MKVSIEFKDIEKQILKALAEEIDEILGRVAGPIEKRIRATLLSSIQSSSTYQSLNSGILQHELGVQNIQSKLDVILRVWTESIEVNVQLAKFSQAGLKASLSIKMIDGSFQDVLSLPEARYITEKGVDIPWLEWLLLYGPKIIVRDYFFTPNIKQGSRTNYGVMKSKQGSSWRIPPEHAGTINNNWITKVLEDVSKEIDSIVDQEIGKYGK